MSSRPSPSMSPMASAGPSVEQEMRDQRLAVEVVEAVLAVRENEREPIGHVGNSGAEPGRRSGSPAGTRRRGGPTPAP